MSLSKRNLDKLNQFIKNKNSIEDSHNINNHSITNKKRFKNHIKSENPNQIFYSLIDNSESLHETSKVNHLLRDIEADQLNINSRKADYSNKLSAEEELYDEFNYLLEE